MAKRNRDTSRKHDMLLHAAMNVFSEKGYDAANLEEIAVAAGASKRTIYNHFRDKDDLFKEVLDKFLAGAVSLKHIEYDRNKSLGEQLLGFADAEIALSANPQWLNFMKVLLSRLINDNEFAKESHEKYSAHHKDLEIWIGAAVEDGRLSVTDHGLAADLFSAMLSGAFTFPALYQRKMSKDTIETLKKEIIETFLQRYAVG